MMTEAIGLGPWAALYMAVAILGAGFVRGYSGFGFSALVIVFKQSARTDMRTICVCKRRGKK